MGWIANWYSVSTVAPPIVTPGVSAGDSPFAPNAMLTFQIPLLEFDAVNDLGEPSAVTEPFLVQAYLRQKSAREESLNDADLSRVPVKGRCVSPTVLPASLKPGAKAIITTSKLTGEFYLQASLRAPVEYGIEAALGDRLEGYILSDVAWGEAL